MNSGKLYVISTPIGHLGDITLRAIEILQDVDLILAEDTRHSHKLMKHYNISTHLHSFHEHNEKKLLPQCLAWLEAGKNLALISDAGTPLISDPGFSLIRAVADAQYTILPIPGPSAFVAALSVSGLPVHDIRFLGFLPAKAVARNKLITSLKDSNSTLIFYESPHRLLDTLTDLERILGKDRQTVLAHEMTKTHESFQRGRLEQCRAALQSQAHNPKGEWVILIAAQSKPSSNQVNISLEAEALLALLKPHVSTKIAAQIASDYLGGSKRVYYNFLLN